MAALGGVASYMIEGFTEGYENPRGIPRAEFPDNIEEFVTKRGGPDNAVNECRQLYSKYKVLESTLADRKDAVKARKPDLTRTLEMIKFLKKKNEAGESFETTFKLSHNVQCEAEIDATTDKVLLWLGADVAIEMGFDEALDIIEGNILDNEQHLGRLEEDLAYLKEQIVTMEVTIARAYNHGVALKRQKDGK